MSDDDDDSSKTEDPSGKKLDKAHEEGNFPRSSEANHFMALLGILIIVTWLSPAISLGMKDRLSHFLADFDQIPTDAESIRLVVGEAMLIAVTYVIVPLLLLMVLGILATILQIGPQFNSKLLKFDFAKLNPMAGLARMFKPGTQALELGKNLAKLIAVSIVSYFVLKPVVVSFEHFIGMDFPALLKEVHDVAYKLILSLLIIIFLITAADVGYQNFTFFKKMKMTKQEVKDEHKQSEGDPLVKGKIKGLRMQKARQRMMASVPRADVVVTNPTHFAVALMYDPASGRAPVVLAKGMDFIAANIRKIAEEHDIPLVRNPPLARTLYDTVEIDHEIPAEHYRAVAEIISYVFKLKGRSLKG